jgi:hypothetical protein
MKRLLLIGLAIGGLAFVAAQRADAQPTVLVPRPLGLSFGFPSGYSAYPSYLNYYPYGYYRHPYVHYYPYSYYGSPYYRSSGHRTYHRHHRHHYHHSD